MMEVFNAILSASEGLYFKRRPYSPYAISVKLPYDRSFL